MTRKRCRSPTPACLFQKELEDAGRFVFVFFLFPRDVSSSTGMSEYLNT